VAHADVELGLSLHLAFEKPTFETWDTRSTDLTHTHSVNRLVLIRLSNP
jgi:hypothetical protein